MKNNKLIIVLFIVGASLVAFSGQQTKEVARVKIKRGIASVITPDGTKQELKKDMWVKEGSIIKTGEKSFVKLSFIDKSSMNVGPKSELKIEKFSKDDAGVINVLTGKIRSKVTKDYLKMDKNKSKLFIRSKSAVMGIRGTEFLFTANAKNGTSTAVLFEGSVVFNKINKGDNLNNLESIVNNGRAIKPGQFSVSLPNKKKVTVAAKMSKKQIRKLERNEEFRPTNGKEKAVKVKSIVPPGLSGKVVLGGNDSLEQNIKKLVKVNIRHENKDDLKPEEQERQMEDSKGFVKGDDIKPADGSIVDIDSGTVIPLGADSTFDTNAAEWVSTSVGGVDSSGNYLPPEGYMMTEIGEMIKTDMDTGVVEQVVLDIRPLDEVKPLDEIQTVTYTDPLNAGPTPAGNGEPNSEGNDVAPGDEPTAGPAPASEDPNYLPPPPRPGDCSTCNQPNTVYNNGGTAPPPAAKTRVNVQVNQQ